jgi:ATP-dependent 26S proteasome regulatory subunit
VFRVHPVRFAGSQRFKPDSIRQRRLTTQGKIAGRYTQFLVLLDGIEDRGRVIVVGTTNRLEAIDPAIKRPGRFDYHISVPLPNDEGREAILRLHLSRLKWDGGLDAELVASTAGWSGAELHSMVTEAGIIAIKRTIGCGSPPAGIWITQTDLRQALTAVSAKREMRQVPHRISSLSKNREGSLLAPWE